ncbi:MULTISPECIES: Mu-like prophage major head subunit gpT family protein [Pasteurellaceae]|uniref:Mu-like prophage major head subunit gpT family protein n=1 Tax=Pasteurella atlantica TaxID=2827233 RepID=A0AAW8CM45_9PAST|nr:Mu-like prophage major head subunit gpT family protein [Pasteurella atlantica]MDP8040099.1 Mu-like prophage major head subunit gpT family protein [Pasteurella atlantica]MDP8044381.1 Mu-like prophage major head subunit gpT family protein [Pasteurella atlantica]MDP8046371.1 Mu-like prophage major head subunit gpT family protein [Pasteurella atlantica]MDP8062228.1 Mu-like prophage major head subunit gpT family protein [Pasteurella atlantica]MDP8089965.1 Mu-like prophage major head subunit gpT 
MSFKKSELLKALDVALRKEFHGGLGLIKPQWNDVAMRVPSNTLVNTYGFLSQFPKMKEWVGTRTINNMQAQATQIENKTFESTVAIPRTNIEDDQSGVFLDVAKQAGQSAAELPDDLVFGILSKGKSTLCYDGQNFFDTDHPVYENVDGTGSHKTQSNLTTGSTSEALPFYIFDTTNSIKPLIWQERTKPEIETKFDPSKSDKVFMEDVYLWGVRARGNAGFGFWQLAHRVEQTEFTAENIMSIVATMQSLKGDGGKLLNIRPNVILVPPALEFKARQICEADIIGGTTNVLKGRLKVMVSSQIIE